MTSQADNPPRRLSTERTSPDFNKAVLDRGVEVFLDGIRQVNCVVDYDVDAGVLRRYSMTGLGVKRRDGFHQPIIDTKRGTIRVEWRG